MNYQSGFSVAPKTNSSSRVSPCVQVLGLAFFIAAQGVFLTADGGPQGHTPPSSTAKQPAKKKYTLRITKEGITGVSLKADKAKLSEIAVDLSRRLGAKVVLGPTMETEAITVEFADLTLEPAMRLLAPHVYLDYEIQAGAQPALLGILLLGDGDPAPLSNAVVEGSSQAMIIEGNTEDTGERSEDDPLRVDLNDDHLTIKSKKQPLAAVVLTIADVLGVPAEIKYDSNELVDTEIKDMPFEDAITRLSPNIRLYVRADLSRSQRIPLRLSLVPPAARVASQ
ncbi:MAG TPA: hypothetical protein VN920_02680 [Pyrinomonadaceae bacterium]|nr:hypothetical protein [Pyrinomonadaceae bacterium]